MELFAATGAKFAGPVGEHHDGFQLYNSSISDFNSVNMGPKRDVAAELASYAAVVAASAPLSVPPPPPLALDSSSRAHRRGGPPPPQASASPGEAGGMMTTKAPRKAAWERPSGNSGD